MIKKTMLLAALAAIVASCKTVETNETIWVSGFQIKTEAEVETADAYYIQREEQLQDLGWEFFSNKIENFNFEEGQLKAIEVKTEKQSNDKSNTFTKYTFVKELDSKEDNRVLLDGSWILTTLDGRIMNKMVVLPILTFDLENMKISGNGGCNQYFGGIYELGTESILLDEIGSTLKECSNENVELDYFQALGNATSYKVDKEKLTLLNKDDKEVLTFIKTENTAMKIELQGDWTLTTFNGGPINRMVRLPTLNLDPFSMKISGNGGCNSYFSGIELMDGENITFSAIGSTKMACDDFEFEYFNTLRNVKKYEYKDNALFFKDEEGNNILSFMKVEDFPHKNLLAGEWKAVRVSGEEIDESTNQAPMLNLNVETMEVTGTDGCNSVFGTIVEITESVITFDKIGSTLMACPDMSVADAFSKAMLTVKGYEVVRNMLVFKDENGDELIVFEKQ